MLTYADVSLLLIVMIRKTAEKLEMDRNVISDDKSIIVLKAI
jgi:hypothetical protein